MHLSFDIRHDARRFLAVSGVSLALVIGTTSGAMAAVKDADRDGLTKGQEVWITETDPNDADSNNDGVRDGNEDEDLDGLDNTDDRALFGAAAMDDEDGDDDGIEDGDEDENGDGTDNEDEDDAGRLSDECAAGVEDDADEDVDGDDLDDEDENEGVFTPIKDDDADNDGIEDGLEDLDGDVGVQDGDEDDADEDDDCDEVEDEEDDDDDGDGVSDDEDLDDEGDDD